MASGATSRQRWQTLRHADGIPSVNEVLLVTAENKKDWWSISNNGKLRGARPELIQEMCDETGKRLVLVTLAEFLSGAKDHLNAKISTDTLHQVHEATIPGALSDQWIAEMQGLIYVDVHRLPPWRLEDLVQRLLEQIGYTTLEHSISGDRGYDLLMTKASDVPPSIWAVEVKGYRRRLPILIVQQLLEKMTQAGIQNGLLVTTGSVSDNVAEFAASTGRIEIIDESHLEELVANHLGINLWSGPPSIDESD